jgi:hypothetical protein
MVLCVLWLQRSSVGDLIPGDGTSWTPPHPPAASDPSAPLPPLVPSVGALRPDDPAYRSPRSCAVPYPARELGGLLWVWGEGGPAAAAQAAAKHPTLPPEVQVGAGVGQVQCGGCYGMAVNNRPFDYSFVGRLCQIPVQHDEGAGG